MPPPTCGESPCGICLRRRARTWSAWALADWLGREGNLQEGSWVDAGVGNIWLRPLGPGRWYVETSRDVHTN